MNEFVELTVDGDDELWESDGYNCRLVRKAKDVNDCIRKGMGYGIDYFLPDEQERK